MPKSSRIPDFFRRIALKGWRKSAYFTFTSSYPVMRRWLISQLSPRHQKILSIGCGSGELERDLLKGHRRITGVDICFEMLQAARHRGLKQVVQADALHLPFAASSFEVIIFPESIGYFELDEVLPGVALVLKRRGLLLITAYPPGFAADRIYRNRSGAQLTRELKQCGFSVVDQRLLTVKRSRVLEVSSESKCQIIYIMAAKETRKSLSKA